MELGTLGEIERPDERGRSRLELALGDADEPLLDPIADPADRPERRALIGELHPGRELGMVRRLLAGTERLADELVARPEEDRVGAAEREVHRAVLVLDLVERESLGRL